MTRGDVSVPQNEYIRTMKVFDDYEKNAIIRDDTLKLIIENDLYYKNCEIIKTAKLWMKMMNEII